MKTANSGLQTVEYLFVAVSMVGIGIAIFTQEITYAAIPLMISLLLNIFNRQQVEENILFLEKKLLEEQEKNKAANEDIPPVNYSENLKAVETKLEKTEEALAQFKQDLQHYSSSFDPNELKSQLGNLQTTLSLMQNRLDLLNPVDLSGLQQEMSNLQQRLESFAQLPSEIAQIKQNYQILERGLQDSKSELNNLLNLIQSLPTHSELEGLRQQFDSLTELNKEVHNWVTWESFNSLSTQLNDLVEQFNNRTEPETIRGLSNEVKNLSESLANLNFNQFGEQIKKLREQFEAIPQKDLVEALSNQGDELNKIEQKLNETEEKILSKKSPINPSLKKRTSKPKPRRVRMNQKRR